MSPSPPARDLNSFFDPSSVAVVGASDTPGKWGNAIAMGALLGAARRSVYLVNHSGRDVLGQPTYRSLSEVPEPPELVVLAVPMSGFDTAVDGALARGAKAIVAINAGFAEIGAAGADHQLELVRRVRSAGASLLGPNCMGLVDNDTALNVAWLPDGSISPGTVGVISQSGNLGYDISRQLNELGLGVSRWISLGNQADIGATDVIRSFAEHDTTRLIAIYCEDFRDGRAFLTATQEAVGSGKPVIVLAAGGNEATARAARSHTGALTTDDALLDTVCRASGAVRVATPSELVDVAQILLGPARPRGRRMAVLSDGGGHAVISTAVVTSAGFRVEPFSDDLRRALTAATDDNAGTANPVDLASANTDPNAMERVIRAVVESGEADGIVMSGGFGSLELVDAELGKRELASAMEIARIVGDAKLPMISQTVAPETETNTRLRAAGVPVFREIERGVNALRRVAEAGEHPPEEIVDLPPEPDPPDMDGYFGARRLLIDGGLSFPEARPAETVTEALAAAERIGYPVVLKAVSLLHKSDEGGVALDLVDDRSLRDAVDRMHATIADPRYSVEAMVQEPDAVELVIGCRRDPRFGPVLLVGLGSIFTEVLRDFKLVLAPAAPAAIERALRSLQGASLLDGPRGRRPVDVAAVTAAAARISEVAARHPSIREIEVNPLLAYPGGAIALDARVVRDDEN
jgi:acyl-CoA synthetase (NDP forming)